MSDYQKIIQDGLWHNNPGLVQILGLCPLMAVSSTFINGLGLGLATIATLTLSGTAISLIRHHVSPDVRIPVFVAVIASIVTAIQLAMNAFVHELYLILGLFIALIVTNCAVLGRAEAFASKNTPARAALDGFMMGVGFTVVLITLGALREALGKGTLLDGAHLMFGETARGMTIHLVDDYAGFLLAVLPPGAFIGLGLLIALKNVIDTRRKQRAATPPVSAATPAVG